MGEMNQIEALRIALEAIRDNKRFNNGVTAQAIADEALTCLASLIIYSKEKDREIERMKAEVEARISTTGERCDQIRRAIGAAECLAWDLVVEQVASLQAQLSASQAREREAVERAEKAEHHERVAQRALSSADCRYAGRVVEMGGSHCPIGEPCDRCAADRRESRLESALAAARKALEELLGWFTTPCHPGEPAMKAMVPVRELARFRAALNGDS